jgi:hypothetical protein
MNKDHVTKWIAALRSGEYTQTTKRLHDRENGGFCCLGVLCDLYAKDHPEAGWKPDEKPGVTNPAAIPFYDNMSKGFDVANVNSAMPSANVLAWAGLDWRDVFYQNLAVQNDNGATFEVIADIIQRELDDTVEA